MENTNELQIKGEIRFRAMASKAALDHINRNRIENFTKQQHIEYYMKILRWKRIDFLDMLPTIMNDR